MNRLMILAGVAALAATSPALADPGHGHGGDKAGWKHDGGGGEAKHRGDRGDRHGNWHGDRDDRGHARWQHGDEGQRWHRHGRHRWANGYGVGGCPPGLARWHNGCVPPGHARRYAVGYHLPYGYNSYTSYSRIPYNLRQRYNLDPNDRYIYDNGYVYQVDPTTRIISQVLSAIIR